MEIASHLPVRDDSRGLSLASRRSSRAGLLGLLLMHAVLVASCGGSNENANGPVAGAPAPAPSPSPAPAPTPATAPAINPQPTAVGTPAGSVTSVTIGTAGGTLATTDGALKLTFPAGALATDTVIGVQPITNFAINGTGPAYRLTPEGTTFAQPVQLTFSYGDALVAGSAPQALAIATQDAQGYWRLAPSPARDLTAKTISVSIPHFSDWSPIQGVQLTPRTATLNVNDTQDLRVVSCDQQLTPGSGDDLLAWPAYQCSDSDLLAPITTTTNWAVNGAPGGTSGTGTVAITASSQDARYTAPAKTPAPATVSVSVNATSRLYGTLVLVSNITILGGGYTGTLDIPAGDAAGNFGAQHVEVTWTRADPDPLTPQGGATYYGTGYWTTTVTGASANCEPQTVTLPLHTDDTGAPTSQLEVYGGSTGLAGKYRFSIFTTGQTVTMTCNGVPAPTYIGQSILADRCPSDANAGGNAPTYTDATQLVQSSGFDVATGDPPDGCTSKMKGTWKFAAK